MVILSPSALASLPPVSELREFAWARLVNCVKISQLYIAIDSESLGPVKRHVPSREKCFI